MDRSIRGNPPFVSLNPPYSSTHVGFTPSRSRESSVLLGVHRCNMLFCSFNGSLPHGFVPNPSHTKILPSHGPSKADQHLHEP